MDGGTSSRTHDREEQTGWPLSIQVSNLLGLEGAGPRAPHPGLKTQSLLFLLHS